MSTYSFADVSCTITGPGGSFALGASAAPGEEGISIVKEEKNTQIVGADGTVANVLHANENGKITIRLLKTSNANALLSALYNFQKASAANWGQNIIVLVNVVSGDLYTCTGVAFKKYADNTYGKDANTLEWEFDAAYIDPNLGTW